MKSLLEMRWLRTSNTANVFLLVGPPRTYVITRAHLRVGLLGVGSARLFGKVMVEAGKVSYVGDLVFVEANQRKWCAVVSDPASFRARPIPSKICPVSSSTC
jgi:hypothetical protein